MKKYGKCIHVDESKVTQRADGGGIGGISFDGEIKEKVDLCSSQC